MNVSPNCLNAPSYSLANLLLQLKLPKRATMCQVHTHKSNYNFCRNMKNNAADIVAKDTKHAEHFKSNYAICFYTICYFSKVIYLYLQLCKSFSSNSAKFDISHLWNRFFNSFL